MKRLPAIAFGAMVAATLFAFFLTQEIKTNSTLVHGNPQPIPAAFNPVSGRSCRSKHGSQLSYRRTTLSLQPYQAGTVGVYVLDNAGDVVATISQGRYLSDKWPTVFVWKGFENGGSLAPDGTYFFQAVLVKQDRPIDLKQSPITVMTHDPRAPATSVALTAVSPVKAARPVSTTGPVVLTPPAGSVTVHFNGGAYRRYRRLWIIIYRSNASGRLTRVYHFPVKPTQDTATWSGNLAGDVPAPAGTYLIGIKVQDQACNPGSYPSTLHPSPGRTPGAGVTVRYLAATPPLTPTPAGSLATVQVQSPTGPYTWALRLAGSGKVLAHGQAAGSTGSGDVTLKLRLPKNDAALYTLTLSAGQYSTAVPLVASATGGPAARDRVLVVLPMLTWQGLNPVDDTGDGLPDTLTAGNPISLERPLAQNLPSSFHQDSELLAYLNAQQYHYQLTTDVALAEGVGPSLSDSHGVAFAGSETWLPSSLVSILKRFVQGGGSVLSLGPDSLMRSSAIHGYPSDPVASAPKRLPPHLFGVTAPVAGVTGVAPSVTALKLGKGYVVEVGLPDFNSTLAANGDSQALLSRIWQLLAP